VYEDGDEQAGGGARAARRCSVQKSIRDFDAAAWGGLVTPTNA